MQKPLVDPGASRARRPAIRLARRRLRPESAGAAVGTPSGWSEGCHATNDGMPATAGPVFVSFFADGRIAVGRGSLVNSFACHREAFAIVEPHALGAEVLRALGGSAGTGPQRSDLELDGVFQVSVSRDAVHLTLRSESDQLSHVALLSSDIDGFALGTAILQFADGDPIDLENVEYLRSQL